MIRYLKSKIKTVSIFILFILIFNISFLLFHLSLKAVIYPELLCVLIGVIALSVDFVKYNKKLNELKNLEKQISALITDLPSIDNENEEIYQEIIKNLKSEISDKENTYNSSVQDMTEYYSVWAHQIKTPIASMKLSLQNEDSHLTRKLSSDLLRIEQYVEMVLAFLRLDSTSNDYLFKEYELDTIVKQSVRKFASDFIGKKLKLEYTPLERIIITDEKWFSFVIEQILSNSIKYTREGFVKIYMSDENTLCISDTGIGIAPEDLPRIFENGYTGFNGRLDKSASGIGLYLCKRICDNLGIGISVSSELGKGTQFFLDIEQYSLKKE